MNKRIQNIYIVVEGASETQFFARLNSFCRESEIPFCFKVENAENHSQSHLKKALRKAGKKAKADRSVVSKDVFVLLDYDIFKRGENLTPYQERFEHLYFFEYNFEDFLVALLPTDKQQLWETVCKEHRHYEYPMTSTTVVAKIQLLFLNYKKGFCPFPTVTSEHMQRLFCRKFKERIAHVETLLIEKLGLNQ